MVAVFRSLGSSWDDFHPPCEEGTTTWVFIQKNIPQHHGPRHAPIKFLGNPGEEICFAVSEGFKNQITHYKFTNTTQMHKSVLVPSLSLKQREGLVEFVNS